VIRLKQDSGLLWWLTGSGVVVLGAILVGGPILLRQNSELADRLEAATAHGWISITTDTGTLDVDRAFGRVMHVRWEGETISDDRVITEDGIITVFSRDGRVVAHEKLPSADMAEWLAASPWKRIGACLRREGDQLAVIDIRNGSPAAAKGLLVGDRIERIDGRPAVGMELRAALLVRIAGGALTVSTADGRTVNLVLDPLMPAELLAGTHDPLGDYREWLSEQGP
jgi:hypothetical protein